MFNIGKITFLIAEDEKLKQEIYRLRYRIYVEEFGFESPDDHPDGFEKDIYDDHSIHFAGVNSETGEVVATMRIVLHSHMGFPLEHIDEVSFVGEPSDLKKIIEVSRFAVDASYRRRKEDILFKGKDIVEKQEFDRRRSQRNTTDRRQKPVVVYGLFRLLYQTTKKLGVKNWCMISEEYLHAALSKIGFIFHPIGRKVDYHGIRTPYIAFIDEMEEGWMKHRKEFILFLSEGLNKKHWNQNEHYLKLMNQVNESELNAA